MNTGSGIKNILLSYKTQNTVVLSDTSLCAIVRVVQNNLMSKIAPSETFNFMTWKTPNPRRKMFI